LESLDFDGRISINLGKKMGYGDANWADLYHNVVLWRFCAHDDEISISLQAGNFLRKQFPGNHADRGAFFE
jgi:hypothetical protein